MLTQAIFQRRAKGNMWQIFGRWQGVSKLCYVKLRILEHNTAFFVLIALSLHKSALWGQLQSGQLGSDLKQGFVFLGADQLIVRVWESHCISSLAY